MGKLKLFFFNILPTFFVMAVIFIASLQTSEEQDISEYLQEVSSESALKNTIANLLQKLDQVLGWVTNYILSYPLLSFIIFLIGFVIFIYFLFRFTTKKNQSINKRIVKAVSYGVLALVATGALLISLHGGTIINLAGRVLSFEDLRRVLGIINFTYAGFPVNIEAYGVVGFLTFILRKFAHFFLFMLLGFTFYLMIYKFGVNKINAVLYTLLFIVLFAAFDEFRQSFIPSRSALIEDVILDTAGGAFGILLAFLKKVFSEKWK